MNDLDAFRAALREPVVAADAIDIGQIMRQGARVRRRRRLATAAIGSATAVVLVVGGAHAADVLRPGGDVGVSVAAPDGSAAPQSTQDGDPWGTIVRTGVAAGDTEWLLYMVRLNAAELPDTRIGVVLGVPDADGIVTNRLMGNETEGSDRAPGFHAVSASVSLEDGRTPVFGYYVGAAAGITAGRVTARQARWSEDPSVLMFWFDPADTPAGWRPTGLSAYDSAGRKLPSGNNQAAVG